MITKPVFSEKSYALTAFDTYTFRADRSATKFQLKEAIEKAFDVKVEKIHTTIVKPSVKRSLKTGHNQKERGYKKVTVRLQKGQKISLFNV
jgi:large subunit ribosomal protein L23